MNDELHNLMNQGQNLMAKLMECNEYTKKFGLTLTKEDALVLSEDRKDSLVRQQRIEFGQGILQKLIFTFCDSPYIYQENYVDTIGRLQDIFYLYKNESLDEATDDELLEFMKKAFDGVCQGSAEYLEDTILDRFASSIRNGSYDWKKEYLKEHAMNGEWEDEDELF